MDSLREYCGKVSVPISGRSPGSGVAAQNRLPDRQISGRKTSFNALHSFSFIQSVTAHSLPGPAPGTALFPHSDGFAQDFHLFPYYLPRSGKTLHNRSRMASAHRNRQHRILYEIVVNTAGAGYTRRGFLTGNPLPQTHSVPRFAMPSLTQDEGDCNRVRTPEKP